MREIGIGKKALLPLLVVLLMVIGSFGTSIFVQNAGTDTGIQESEQVYSLTGETISLSDEMSENQLSENFFKATQVEQSREPGMRNINNGMIEATD
ncbi:MAG: hypothetical protein KAI64_03080, partial [Thermoplasmata archaeon]|nr:hypothetical protein [Thermoplasmata archaeon]